MATTFDHRTGAVGLTEVVGLPAPADPAPLGLGAFALTTFLLSVYNAHWTHGTTA
jgi:succinate-acetate transporter protein